MPGTIFKTLAKLRFMHTSPRSKYYSHSVESSRLFTSGISRQVLQFDVLQFKHLTRATHTALADSTVALMTLRELEDHIATCLASQIHQGTSRCLRRHRLNNHHSSKRTLIDLPSLSEESSLTLLGVQDSAQR